MILDSGLDMACVTPAGPTNNNFRTFTRWAHFAAFGTGSAAPAPSDVALGGQVGSRVAPVGTAIDTSGVDVGSGVLWYEVTKQHNFAISANVNATEWGLAAASSGDLSVRELFRENPADNTSSPIALTLEAGDELQLFVTIRVETPFGTYAPASFVITGTTGSDGNGLHEGVAGVGLGSVASAHIENALRGMWPGGASQSTSDFGGVNIWDSDQSANAPTDPLTGSAITSSNLSAENYTPGAFERQYTATFGTGDANAQHRAWVMGASPNPGGVYRSTGLRFLLQDPAFLDKTSLHRLVLRVVKRVSRL